MAIKSSNQITFSEHKKIKEIKEWYLATPLSEGITIETKGWTTDIQTIDYTNKYLWNYEEVIYSIGSSDVSEPVIIGFYGKGEVGKGISNIKNYYQITQNLVAPEIPKSNEESSWSDVSITSNLSPINKYLWNYEAIIYTDGSVTTTDPAIIGVYGDSGADAITFEIYSTQGFMFKEGIDEIELKIAAFQGSTPITDATYTWEWWDSSLNDGEGDYVSIEENSTDQSLTIYKLDKYALAHLKCTMTYDGNIYEDYVNLTNEIDIYSSVVKFFDGSNIFSSSKPYLIAYISLYKNNDLVESIISNNYYDGENSVSNGLITTDMVGEFEDGTLVYFIYKENSEYKIVLGEYKSGSWHVYNNSNQYIYTNDIYNDVISNVIVISKEDVSKSRDINFVIYKNKKDKNGNYICNDDTYVSTTNVIVVDINDPIISSTEPENVNYGQLWLDISSTPYMLYIYTQVDGQDSGRWEYFSQQNGGAIYTSQPSKYSAGDLWILADGEECGEFGPGSMLKATTTSNVFNKSHWSDAMEENSEVLNNVKQYFSFNKDTGLRIGKKNEQFYVNIDAEEMGFYDNSDSNNPNQKVVWISNKAANIKNVVVEDSAKFNCNATFNKQVQFGDFIWKVERNGSLSLAISN